MTGDGVRFYHLYVGTQRNCVVDLTFSVKQGTTDIQVPDSLFQKARQFYNRFFFRKCTMVQLVSAIFHLSSFLRLNRSVSQNVLQQ